MGDSFHYFYSQKHMHSSDIGEQQQASSELILASAQHSAGQSITGGHLINSNQQGSSIQSMTSFPSSAASVRACKVLLLQKQRALAAVKGSGMYNIEQGCTGSMIIINFAH